jgi:hypothetical protein
MDDSELAGKLRSVSMATTANDLLKGRIDRSTVAWRLRRDSYSTTDARWKLADAVDSCRKEPR